MSLVDVCHRCVNGSKSGSSHGVRGLMGKRFGRPTGGARVTGRVLTMTRRPCPCLCPRACWAALGLPRWLPCRPG